MEKVTLSKVRAELKKELTALNKRHANTVFEDTHIDDTGTRIKSVCAYARWCEVNAEMNMKMFMGKERETTFTSDFSIADWYDYTAVTDTVDNSGYWFESPMYATELIIALQFKAMEMCARKKFNWAAFYNELWQIVRKVVEPYIQENWSDEDLREYNDKAYWFLVQLN